MKTDCHRGNSCPSQKRGKPIYWAMEIIKHKITKISKIFDIITIKNSIRDILCLLRGHKFATGVAASVAQPQTTLYKKLLKFLISTIVDTIVDYCCKLEKQIERKVSKTDCHRGNIAPSKRGDSLFYRATDIIKQRIKIIRAIINISDVKFGIFATSFRGFKFAAEVSASVAQPQSQLYKTITKTFLTFLAIFTITNTSAYGQTAESLMESDIFKSNYEVTGSCEMQCREVKSGYKTEITGFDVTTGITGCKVYIAETHMLINIEGGTKNKQCVEEIKAKELQPNDLWSIKALEDTKGYAQKKIESKFNKMTMSKFLAALMTLDPDIIDFDKTVDAGILVLHDPTLMYGTNTVDTRGFFSKTYDKIMEFFFNKGVDQTKIKLVNTADSLNKANLGFFASLYHGLQKIYSHAQALLLVFIGSFFIISIAFKRGIKMLDKSNDDDGNRWLMTVTAPALGIVFFFLPIPEDAGMSTNIVQKITRHFVQRSVSIADEAAAVGINAYMNKLYGSVGAMTANSEKMYREGADTSRKQFELYNREIKRVCENRYDDYKNKQFPTDPKEIEKAQKYIKNQNATDIEFLACTGLQLQALYSQANADQLDLYVNQIKYTFDESGDWKCKGEQLCTDGNQLRKKLELINDVTQNRLNELGWLQAVITAPWFIFIENMSAVTENDASEKTKTKNEELVKKRLEAAEGMPKKDYVDDALGWLLGKTVYFMLPGASEVYKFMTDSKVSSALKAAVFLTAGPIVFGAYYVAEKPIALILTAWLYEKMLKYLPIIFCVVAAIIATIGYLVELAKFFYVMPFVVAFSMTTRRVNKIFDFLLTGIAIFFKPILIVIFIFFALFAHGLVYDVFMMLLNEQFSFITGINENMLLACVMGVFFVLLSIIASIGSMYIMWKLILTAPSWTLKMVGLDGNNDVFVDSLANKLERHSFQV